MLRTFVNIVVLVSAALFVATGCAGSQTASQQVGDSGWSSHQLQAELTALGDQFIARVTEATSALTRNSSDLRQRRIAHTLKLVSAEGAITNIGGPSPVAGLLDMTVMVTLMRMKLEEHAPRLFGESADVLIDAFERSEDGFWNLCTEVLSEQEMQELHNAIREWNLENQDMNFVAKVRLSDFAHQREATPTRNRGILPSNILQLFYLDPLAGLDPTVREIEQTRLLAERVIYQAQRMPRLLRWETEALYLDLVSSEGVQKLLENIDQAANASTTLSGLAEELPQFAAEERTQTIQELEAAVERQRRETIAQVRDVIQTDTRVLLDDLNNAQEPLQASLTQLDNTIASAGDLTSQLTELLRASDALATKLGLTQRVREPRPANDADGMETFEQATMRIQSAAHDVTELLIAATRLLETPALQEPERVAHATNQASDKFFKDVVRAGVTLILIAAAALLIVLVIHCLLGYALARRAQRSETRA